MRENYIGYMWFCPKCEKFDLATSKENMAAPEHVPYRGADIGTCKGEMVKLYRLED